MKLGNFDCNLHDLKLNGEIDAANFYYNKILEKSLTNRATLSRFSVKSSTSPLIGVIGGSKRPSINQ